MPFTFNGFGTRYSGRSNLIQETATCEFCGREARISSYDTRLFLCALYIPVIPLGRKRVLDECSRCRKHRVMELEQWHRLEQEVLERGNEVRRGAPDDPGPALEHLAALGVFHRDEEALALAEDLARRFPDDPRVLLAATSHLLAAGREEEADRLLERACRLDPANPGARRLLAYRHIACGRLDQARSLVDAPGAGDLGDPGLLLMLARGYQERGDHFSALERLRALIAAHPELGQNKEVRKAIRTSEKAAGAPQSILPRRRLRLTRATAVLAGIALLIAGAAGLHLYRRAHREVEVVSALPGAISIAVDGGEPVELVGPARSTLTVSEGSHRAEVTGALEESIDFSIETPWWQGLGGQPLFVLDPGGLAAVAWEESYYGSPPAGFEPRLRVYAGRRFFRFDDVDYRFTKFPAQIQLSSSSKGEARSRVYELSGEPVPISGWLVQLGEPEQAADYLEAWLAREPSDDLALNYAGTAVLAGRADEAADRLHALLEVDPINLEFHRAYQEAAEVLPDRDEQLRREYDELLERRPGDPAALYLRGRIEPDPARAEALYARARAIDPLHEHAARASAFAAMSRGDFVRATEVLSPVAGLEEASNDAVDLYLEALEAVGRDAELEAILEPARSNAGDGRWNLLVRLLHLLVRTGRTEEAEQWVATLEQSPGGRPLGRFLHGHLLYATGDLERLREHARQDGFLPGHAESMAFWAAVELDDARAIGECYPRLPPYEREGTGELILALEHARRGEDGISQRWQQQGLDHLASFDRAYREFAELLEAPEPVTGRALDAIVLPARDKALLLTLLAVRRPETAELALRRADRLNFQTVFPHRFLRSFQPSAAVESPSG